MSRGYLGDFISNPAYVASTKDWYITLQQSSCYWYDLIVNPPDFVNTKDGISSQLEELRAKVEQSLEKRFIYFFASRTKVRFDTKRPPKYSFRKKWLIINFLVGRDKKRCAVRVGPNDPSGRMSTHQVEVSERFIRFVHSGTESYMFSVHDFLQAFNIEMGISTRVHYVGITKDPSGRPLNRKHRGIADTLYNVSNEENDFFIFVNLFKVLSSAKNDVSGFHFVVANSAIDEIPTDEEGRVVESALIAYFDCASQRLNRKKEQTILSNQLAALTAEHAIRRVSVHLEMMSPSEYFVFGSDGAPPASSHSFSCCYENGEMQLTSFASEDELQARLRETYAA